MHGVVSGLDYVPSRPLAAPQANIDLLEMLQPQAVDYRKMAENGVEYLEGEERQVQPGTGGYSVRLPTSTADGVPNDYGMRPIMMVIDGDPVTGAPGVQISAEQYSQQILNQQQLLKGQRSMAPPMASGAASPDMASAMLQLLSNPAMAAQFQQLMAANPAQVNLAPPVYAAPQPPPTFAAPQYSQPQVPKGCTTEECGLAFLTNPPSRPEVRVEYDLGVGGKHKKRYHHVSYKGNCLSLIYDTRYDDDEFVPPSSLNENNDPTQFTISVAELGFKFRCMMYSELNNKIGLMSVINLFVTDEPEPLD